jgi:membrane protease subunit HflK
VRFPRLEQLPKIPFVKIVLVLLVLVLAFSSFYTVDPEEAGVVLRLGRFVDITAPGLHWKIPLGVDRVIKVPVERQLKQEFGFRTAEAGVRTQYDPRVLPDESLMLTGDLNVADVEWVVQYRIVDPRRFLFRVRNPEETLRMLSEAVMRQTVGDRTVNEVLTVGRQEIATLVEQKLQELLEQYETGLHVEQIVLQNVTPPDPVRPSFNEVNQAEQEREQKVNAAQSEYNLVIPRARGEALQTIAQAEGYALERVNRAEGDAARFTAVFEEYQRAPEVTRRRLYLETLGEVLPQAGQRVVVDEDARSVLPLLNLGGGAGVARPAPAGAGQGGGS